MLGPPFLALCAPLTIDPAPGDDVKQELHRQTAEATAEYQAKLKTFEDNKALAQSIAKDAQTKIEQALVTPVAGGGESGVGGDTNSVVAASYPPSPSPVPAHAIGAHCSEVGIDAVLPVISAQGMEANLEFPLSSAMLEEFITTSCEPATVAKGAETVVNKEIRTGHQLKANQFKIVNLEAFQTNTLQPILQYCARKLGFAGTKAQLYAEQYKMLAYTVRRHSPASVLSLLTQTAPTPFASPDASSTSTKV